MKFGICTFPGALPVGDEKDIAKNVANLLREMENAGADYVEFAVGVTAVDGDQSEYETLRAALAEQKIKPEAFNGFIPPKHRITGPDVDFANLMRYATTALGRCKELGGEVVVLGSGGARSLPDGFDQKEGEKQFVQFCRELGPVCDEIGISIAIEPLNAREDNLVNSVAHGARIVDEVAHPRIQLLADLYHIAEDRESLEGTASAGARLAHTHLADRGRVAPGYSVDGEEDFLGFFRALRTANYDARCSFEGKFEDIGAQLSPTIKLMKQRWRESA